MRHKNNPAYDGDGRREMKAIDQKVLKEAVDLDQRNLGAGAVLRLRIAAAMRREFAAYQAEQRRAQGQTQP